MMLQFLAQCVNCGDALELDSSKVFKTKVEMPDGKPMWLTHFECPECGHVHFVQIDDERTQTLLKDLAKVLAATARAKRMGRRVKKQSAKYHCINRDLNAIRSDLEKEYSGAAVFMPGSQVQHTLEFVKLDALDVEQMKMHDLPLR